MNERYAPHWGRTRNARDLPADPSHDSDRACNKRIRDLSGFEEPLPAVGDRLVRLRNDQTKSLIGGLWRVEAHGGMLKDFVCMRARSEDEGAAKSVRSLC
jgi:hypothetical protein